ncbi:MBOAT family protein [Marinilabiliaceae bacterium JC017]|nr:MBOAT family protein [Marinilabiliaceae bacterium JC017]
MEKILEILKQQGEALFLFTNIGFWLFFGVVLTGHALFYKKRVLRSSFLLLVSLYFYYRTGGYFFSLLIFSTITDYFIGIGMGKAQKEAIRRGLLVLSLFLNLSLLCYFKYTYFFAEVYNSIFDSTIAPVDYLAVFSNNVFGTEFSISDIILPVGISFFTFQTISYSIDVYRREVKPVKSIVDFGFYVSFFPQLIAGPIVRARDFIPQLYQSFQVSSRQMWGSVWLILAGLLKKMVISDYLSVNLVDRVFETPEVYSGFEILTGIYGYALQIYCDFSGYTDIAIGVAMLLGFRLPVNFNHPYKARSLTDFWRRWHISLSAWLKDYLYIPLGGSRKGKIRRGMNLLITMFLGGLWHGANWRFILWGLLHGFGLIVDKFFNKLQFKSNWLSRAAGWFFTFHFVVFAWLIFRSNSLDTVHILLYRLVNTFQPGMVMNIVMGELGVYLILLVGFLIHFIPDSIKAEWKNKFIALPVVLRIVVTVSVLLIITQLRVELQPFIYFKF